MIFCKLSIKNLTILELELAMLGQSQGDAGQTTFALANWRK